MKYAVATGCLLGLVCLAQVGSGQSATRPAATRPAEGRGPETRAAEGRVNGNPINPETVESVFIVPTMRGWELTVRANGSARLLYGSTSLDSASVPAGTVDFKTLVFEVSSHQTTRPLTDATTAWLRLAGTNSTQGYPLDDDTYVRKLFKSLDGKWKDKGWRFDELRKEFPYYSGKARR